MADITRTIGTSSRNYSTITAWESDLDNGAVYSSTDNAIGECYADSDFTSDDSVTIDGGTTVGLSSITLRAASGERHDGTASGGGVVVDANGSTFFWRLSTPNINIDWMRFTKGTNNNANHSFELNDNECYFRNSILHDIGVATQAFRVVYGVRSRAAAAETCYITNNIIYDIEQAASGGGNDTVQCYGIAIDDAGTTYVYNNTVYNCTAASDFAYGIYFSGAGSATVTNNICMNSTTSDFSGTFTSSATNLSSDATGSTGLQSKTASNQFVSTTGGSEDLHLKTGADAIDAGTDVGTTPTNVAIDIDARNRDTEGDTWDVGAHEFVSAGGGITIPVVVYHRKHNFHVN